MQQFVSTDWFAKDGKKVLSAIRQKGNRSNKSYALLEKPLINGSLAEEFKYKIFVSGCTGVGKTATVANLCGYTVPTDHSITPGIQMSISYWPAKIIETEKIVLFHLAFWDAGEVALQSYDHVLQACRADIDAIIFMFSFDSKSSFDDLPKQMSRVLQPNDNIHKFVIGTKFDLQIRTEVTQRDIQVFESSWQIPIQKICNRPDDSASSALTNEVAPLLNFICNELWARDRRLTVNR